MKMQSGGSAKRPVGTAGLERRPLVGTRCATAQRTARRRPAGWLSLGATRRRGRFRTSVAQDDERRVARGPSARCADRSPVTVKTQSRGSVERLDGAAGLERRPPVGTALRDRAAHGTADRRDGSLSQCNRAEGTFPDLCRPGRPAARRPRAFGPLCRPEVGVPSRFRLSRQAGCAGGPDHRLLRHVPRQPIPPQRHVTPAGRATATCTPPTDPASATCASRRTRYCDMYLANRPRLSDMCLPQDPLLRHVPAQPDPLQRHVPPQDRLLRHVTRQPIPPQRHVTPAESATATCDPPADPASATCDRRRTRYCDM